MHQLCFGIGLFAETAKINARSQNNSWQTKEVLTKTADKKKLFRSTSRIECEMLLRFWIRHTNGLFVRLRKRERGNCLEDSKASGIYHTVDRRTIVSLDNKFIEYYLLNDFFPQNIYLRRFLFTHRWLEFFFFGCCCLFPLHKNRWWL